MMVPTDPHRVLETVVETVRRSLHDAFGWTWLEVTLDVDAASGAVRLRGEVLVTGILRRLTDAIEVAGHTVDACDVHVSPGQGWHALPAGTTPLWRARPGHGVDATLATELLASDGPVEVLARVGDDAVVRGIDGTVGWTDRVLGRAVTPPRIDAPTDEPGAVATHAVRYCGVVYRWGGTTEGGMDCSGLVWRCVKEATHAVVPRHSSDQLSLGPCKGAGDDVAGVWVFVWSRLEAPGHVGMATGNGSIVHASRSRRRVVEDRRDAFLQGASRVMHVPWSAVVALHRRFAGASSLALDALNADGTSG
jgi:hypothetical protein